MKEERASVEIIRPGRQLFVRKREIGFSSSPHSLQLVCIHGLCATEQQFHSLLQALDEELKELSIDIRIECWLYDWMGCGQSPVLTDWDAYDNAETHADLEAFLERSLDSQKRTVIIGHSYGPNIIVRTLQDYSMPHLIGMVFMSTAFRTETSTELLDGGHPLMRLPVSILQCLQNSMTNAFVEMAVHSEYDELKETVREESNKNDMYAAKAYHRHMVWASVDLLLQNNHLPPTLVVHGADDGVVAIQRGQELANSLETELVVIEKASHLVMMEQPKQVASHIVTFLQQVLKNQ